MKAYKTLEQMHVIRGLRTYLKVMMLDGTATPEALRHVRNLIDEISNLETDLEALLDR